MVSGAGIVRFRADRSSAARYSGGPARLTDPAELFADPAKLSSAGELLFFPLFFLVSIFQGGASLELFLIVHCIKLSENIKNIDMYPFLAES
jgi:hypothetical protein